MDYAVSLRQMQYIVSVADLGGFRKAADVCRVAQPSLSAQIAQAERDLGVQLFERDRRGARLTTAGQELVARIRQVLVAAADLQAVARRLSDPFLGTMRLGVIPTVAPYLLPEITPEIARAHSGLTLLWTEGRTSSLVRQVKDGQLDGAILAREADLGGLEQAELAWDPFVLAAAPDHPIVQPRTLATPDVLHGACVLLLEDGHSLRDQALELCAIAGTGDVGFSATSLATLVQMVSVSASVTLLPSLAVPVENRRGQLKTRRFASPFPGRTIVMAWRPGSSLAKPLAELSETIRGALGHAIGEHARSAGFQALAIPTE